ncbi:unnamed protein product [Brassica oleracea]
MKNLQPTIFKITCTNLKKNNGRRNRPNPYPLPS